MYTPECCGSGLFCSIRQYSSFFRLSCVADPIDVLPAVDCSFYDSEGLGYLREQDLENYVYDHIPTMAALHAIHDNFYPFYVFTAVRRFMFFLDPKRTGAFVACILFVTVRCCDDRKPKVPQILFFML